MVSVCCRNTALCRHNCCKLESRGAREKGIFQLSFDPILRLSRKLRSWFDVRYIDLREIFRNTRNDWYIIVNRVVTKPVPPRPHSKSRNFLMCNRQEQLIYWCAANSTNCFSFTRWNIFYLFWTFTLQNTNLSRLAKSLHHSRKTTIIGSLSNDNDDVEDDA